MKKVLINFAHPARRRSTMNNALRKAVEGLDHVTINDLYSNYPDYLIDVPKEQQLCEEHDIIIFQHPFYWYSTPAIMKEWLDLVLQHGWAYGSSATTLHGKLFLQALTAGGEEETYHEDGYNKSTIRELTSPYRATANLCGMEWIPPFAIFGIHRGISKETAQQHGEEYRKYIIALRDELLDLAAIKQQPYLNSNPA